MLHAQNFVIDDYLARIGLAKAPARDAEGLTLLMRAQLRAVPFENLDVQAGKIVSLELGDIVEKIIYGGRGGYCYEVNGLFAMALTALGFDYRIIGARPMFYPQRRPKTHMVLLVNIDGESWLCDTGFGSFGLRAPLSLASANKTTTQDMEQFRLCVIEQDEWVMQSLVKGEWINQFGFDLYPMEWIDFMPANYFNSTHPDAVFVQKYLVMRQTAEGRVLLSGDQLKRWQHGVETINTITPQQLDGVLWEEFSLRRP